MIDIETKKLSLSAGDAQLAFILFLIYFLCHAYEITHFNISIDDEAVAFSRLHQFVELGRWVPSLIRETFWPQVVTPFGPYIIFGICICLAYLYLLKSFGREKIQIFHLTAFVGFVLFPVWSAQLEFAGNVIPLGIGVLAIALATWLTLDALERPSSRIAALASAAVLVAVATGCYQTALFIFPILVIGVATDRHLIAQYRIAEFRRSLLVMALVVLVAVVIYLLMARLMMLHYGIAPSRYGLSFVAPGALLDRPLAVMSAAVGDLQGLYFSWWKAYGAAPYVFAWVVVGGVAAVLIRTLGSSPSVARVVLVVLALTAILVLPAAWCLVAGKGMPLRSFLAAPAALLVLMLLVYQPTASAAVRGATLATAVVFALEGLYIQSIYQARSYVVQQQDLLLASGLNSAIRKVSNTIGDRSIPLDFHGMQRSASVYPLVYTTTSGASFFEWDEGNPLRMVRYMNLVGYPQYVPVAIDQRPRFASAYQEMPTWPMDGSVKLLDGVVLVKLSE